MSRIRASYLAQCVELTRSGPLIHWRHGDIYLGFCFCRYIFGIWGTAPLGLTTEPLPDWRAALGLLQAVAAPQVLPVKLPAAVNHLLANPFCMTLVVASFDGLT